MREVWDRIEKIGRERGEERIIALLMRLQKENRQEAMRSKEVRDRLYREYQLA